MLTVRPRASRMAPSDAEVIPLPNDETTPPVTKTNLVHEVIGNETFNDGGLDYDIDYVFTGYHTRDENGFTTNNTNQRKSNITWFNKTKLMNSIKK